MRSALTDTFEALIPDIVPDTFRLLINGPLKDENEFKDKEKFRRIFAGWISVVALIPFIPVFIGGLGVVANGLSFVFTGVRGLFKRGSQKVD